MIDPQTVDLINRAIDNELSGEERARLESLIIQDGAIGAVYDEHVRLDALLGSIESPEPPQDLKDSIIAAIRHPLTPKSQSWGLLSLIRPHISKQSLLLFAGGLAAGLAIIALVGPQRTGPLSDWNSSDAAGTIGVDISAQHLQLIDEQTLGGNGQVSVVRTWCDERVTLLELDLRGNSPCTTAVTYLPAQMELTGISVTTGIDEAEIMPGNIRLPLQTPGRVVGVFRRLTNVSLPLEIRIVSGGTVETVSLPAE